MFKTVFFKTWSELTQFSKDKWSTVSQELKVEKISLFQMLLLSLSEMPEAKKPALDMVEYVARLIQDDSPLAQEPFSVIFSIETLVPLSISQPFPQPLLERASNLLLSGLRLRGGPTSKNLEASSPISAQPQNQDNSAKRATSNRTFSKKVRRIEENIETIEM
ncbi:hypothetical protein QYM36_014100, partial [Artemia franciscana]